MSNLRQDSLPNCEQFLTSKLRICFIVNCFLGWTKKIKGSKKLMFYFNARNHIKKYGISFEMFLTVLIVRNFMNPFKYYCYKV